MSKINGKTIAQFFIVIIILGISACVYLFASPENSMKEDIYVGLSDIASGINPVGKLPKEDIELLENLQQFEEMIAYEYIAVKPEAVIKTGVYTRKRWLSPNAGSGNTISTRRRTAISDQTTNPLTNIEYMNEYFLIQLSDDSYILALFDEKYVKEIEQGKEVTLPIGQIEGVRDDARIMLQVPLAQYQAETAPVLYMIDDAWYQENETSVGFRSMLMAIGTFIVLSVIAGIVFSKVFE